MIGCEMELDDRFQNQFSAKMIINGQIVKRDFEVEFGPGMNKGLTTLAINSRGEMTVESVVERK